VNPYQTQDRFLFTAFALLAVPIALALDRFPVLSVPLIALLAAHLTVGPGIVLQWLERLRQQPLIDDGLPPLLPPPMRVLADSWEMVLSNRAMVGRFTLLAAAVIAGLLAAIAVRRTTGRMLFAIAAVLSFLGGAAFRVYHSRIPDEHAKYRFVPVAPQVGYTPGWIVLEEVSRRPLRVAYAGTNLPFYLFGSRLQNEVRYVNVNRQANYMMHDYHESCGEPLSPNATPDWDRRELDEAAWLENLRIQGIDLLFVGFVNRAGGMHNFYDREGFPVERTWADGNPSIFQPVYKDARTCLYWVRFRSP
jgi:hypothetical protein